jgi:hypothetical protein
VGPHGLGGLPHDRIVGPSPVLEGEIEADQRTFESEHRRFEHAQRLIQKFLAGFITFTDHELQACCHAVQGGTDCPDPPKLRGTNRST